MDKLNKNQGEAFGFSKDSLNQNDKDYLKRKSQEYDKKKTTGDPIEEEQIKKAKIEWIRKGNSFLADACDEAWDGREEEILPSLQVRRPNSFPERASRSSA